jgi:hypothetical protein
MPIVVMTGKGYYRPEPVIQKAILIARKVFALPTLSEVLHEAVLGIDNRAIHLGKPRHC